MNTNKIALLLVAVVAMGIFALPSTLSLFAGQHVWYDLGDTGNQVPCEKCHAEIYEEYTMSANGAHKMLAEGTNANSSYIGDAGTYDVSLACGACHRVNNSAGGKSMVYASGDTVGSTPGEEAHAAATIACMACHCAQNESESKWWAPYAGGFMEMNGTSQIAGLVNKSDWQYAQTGHNGTDAAHNAFIIEALNDDTLQDANEACIACHTNIAVKINWTHRTYLEFDVGLDNPVTTASGVHNWNMTNWGANGTAWATVYGNTTGYGNTTETGDWPGDVNGIYN